MVNISDLVGCNVSLAAILNSPLPIIINPVITSTTCGQCNGAATLNASGGTAPYTYSWSNGATASAVNGLCAGVYSVIVLF